MNASHTPPPDGPPSHSRLTPSEQLTYSTVRIVCELTDGATATGTGFFFAFLRSAQGHVPAIVTNKHVVERAAKGHISITLRDPSGLPIPGQHANIEIQQFEKHWMYHPAADVDLCIMPFSPMLTEAAKRNQALFFITLDDTILPSESELGDLGALEDIVMIGYPNGIWDSTNNLPIARRGITATHPGLDYEGRREFMIDAACFPGSSGSPVFLYNTGTWTDRRGNTIAGGVRIKLLGILYAGPQHTATGEIKIINVPTQQRAIAVSHIPQNLGLVIKSARLREFDPLITARIAAGS